MESRRIRLPWSCSFHRANFVRKTPTCIRIWPGYYKKTNSSSWSLRSGSLVNFSLPVFLCYDSERKALRVCNFSCLRESSHSQESFPFNVEPLKVVLLKNCLFWCVNIIFQLPNCYLNAIKILNSLSSRGGGEVNMKFGSVETVVGFFEISAWTVLISFNSTSVKM